jgi:hypothetical protein
MEPVAQAGGAVYQENEIINLISGLVSLLLILSLSRTKGLPRFRFFYAGFFIILLAYTVTIIEGFVFHDFFDLLEHLSYAISGVLFAKGCWSISRLARTAEPLSGSFGEPPSISRYPAVPPVPEESGHQRNDRRAKDNNDA